MTLFHLFGQQGIEGHRGFHSSRFVKNEGATPMFYCKIYIYVSNQKS